MFVLDYLLDNYIMLFELAGLWIMLRISAHTSERMKRLTRIIILLLFLESLSFRVEAWTQTFETLSLARPMLTALTYTLYPVIMLLVMQLTRNEPLPRRKQILLTVPLLVNALICFSSQWTHLVCWFDESNHYTAGLMHRWPYAVFGCYCLLFLITSLFYLRRYSKMNRMVTLYVFVVPIAGVVLTLLLESEDRSCALFTSAILLYYLCLYIHMARIDPLTSLLNRQSYYQDMQNSGNRISGVASVDMNELKYYNDTLGHEAGDLALKTIAGIMQANCGSRATVYRVGGDEFMIFYVSSNEEIIRASIRNMREKLAETPYVCAFGYEVRREGVTLEEMIRVSDQRMYENKAALKQAVLDQGGALHGLDE